MEKGEKKPPISHPHCGLRLTGVNLTLRLGGRTTFAVYLQSFSRNLTKTFTGMWPRNKRN